MSATMKLRFSPTSPFVRKVTVTALETGLHDRITRVPTNPWDPKDDLPAQNPLGKVPALLLEDGETLIDSTLICEYLDSRHGQNLLFPAPGPERWRTMKLYQLADGLLEAAVAMVIEKLRRPEALRWPDWLDHQCKKIERTLDSLEADEEALQEEPDIAGLTLAIALEYLDFRFPDLGWREGRPRLAAWQARMAERPSLQATRPRDP